MKTVSLGELEQRIMNIVWEMKSCSTRDVQNKLGKDRKLAYTTVATVLQRLYEKGLITRTAKTKAHIYFPRVSKESYGRNIAQSFLKRFINSFGDTAIASFAESIEQLPKEKRKYFLKLLKDNEKNK